LLFKKNKEIVKDKIPFRFVTSFDMATVTPKLYMLQYEYVENMLEKRAPFRAEHLALFGQQVQKGNVVLGGMLDYPPTGAAVIFRHLTSNDIEQFIQQEPYVINKLVTKYSIKPYIATSGDDLLKDDLLKM